MHPRKHIIITGTGRAGTSFLMELLTKLGMDTGYKPEELQNHKRSLGRAGYENDIRSDDSPYIVKSPWFCDYADEVFAREDIMIEHIFVPIRNLNAAAQSRIHVTKSGIKRLSMWSRLLMRTGIRKPNFAGGVWHTQSTKTSEQEYILLNQLYKLMLSISNTPTNLTLIRYPRLTQDPAYLFEKLRPIMKDHSYAAFLEVFNDTARPELVNQFNKDDR